MSSDIGEAEVAILIKPLGDGRIETCIYKSPDNYLDDDALEIALDVALTMNALFELALDEESDILEGLKASVESKIQEIMNDSMEREQEKPIYTSDGNVLKINRFTKTKGSC